MRGIFTGVKPKSAHEEMEHERLIKETIKHHQEGTADTPEGQKAFAELREHIDRHTTFLHEDVFKR